jgi:hypothetical protein
VLMYLSNLVSRQALADRLPFILPGCHPG